VDTLQQQYLQALGIQTWELKLTPETGVDDSCKVSARAHSLESIQSPVAVPEPQRESVPRSSPNSPPADWKTLQYRVQHCDKCSLHQNRTQAVFGVGDMQARWMVIGEAPGADEDLQGEPFVGRAGQLLNEMLLAMGLKREQVYIANILKCRPPNNRDPRPEEVQQCEGYLQAQIQLIQPRLILALGRIAAQNLLRTDTAVGRLRKQRFEYCDIPVIVTYHPAYLLRSGKEKRKAWQDLLYAMQVYRSLEKKELEQQGLLQ